MARMGWYINSPMAEGWRPSWSYSTYPTNRMPATFTPTAGGYLAVACLTWMIYDYSLTMNDEIVLIWTRKGYLCKAIFFLLRWSMFGLLVAEVVFPVFIQGYSESQCAPYTWALMAGTIFGLVLVEVILQIRVWVMFDRSKRLLWLNAILWALQMAGTCVIAAKVYPEARAVSLPAPFSGSCYDTRPKALSTIWVTTIVYELYLTLLVVYRIVDEYRTFGAMEGGILRVLVRDSIGWFFLMILIVVCNIVLWDETVVVPGDTAVALVHAAGGIGGGRLILNIRAAAAKPTATLDTLPVSGTMHSHPDSTDTCLT